MKPWGRFFFTFVAYSLALLHTAVPHQHAAPANGITTISSAGCSVSDCMAGFLQTVFSTDLGYGHLETFQKGSDADTDFSSAAAFSFIALLVSFFFIPITTEAPTTDSASFIEKLHKRLILYSTAHLRAPPAVA